MGWLKVHWTKVRGLQKVWPPPTRIAWIDNTMGQIMRQDKRLANP